MEIWNCFGLVESYQRIKLSQNQKIWITEDLKTWKQELVLHHPLPD